MHDITSREEAIYRRGRGAVHMRVRLYEGIENFDVVELDLSDVNGRDFLLGASWGGSNEASVEGMEVSCRLDYFDTSISPLRDSPRISNKLPRVAQGITLETATTAMDADPCEDDYRLSFKGFVDSIAWGGTGHTLVIRARDQGALLLDTFIESEATYGSGPGDPMEDVMGDILIASFGGSAPLIFLPTGSPGALVNTYTQAQTTVMQALTTLANIIGWSIKYRFDPITQDYRLTFYDPAQISTSVEFGFSQDFYLDIPRIEQSRNNIRNVVEVNYLNGGIPTLEVETNAASIAAYGRRYMRITEGDASSIDTATEAETLAQSALTALKDPSLELEISTPFFYAVQEHDTVAIEGNRVHFDDDQVVVVQSYRHTIEQQQDSTRIVCKADPTLGRRQYLTRDARFFEFR